MADPLADSVLETGVIIFPAEFRIFLHVHGK